ncbi:hypothetical protein [Streptomyces noursei]|uniref:hypothetical protein n=1 Tax=Streptomyces noursei TaxID=1971 RepID=UPI001676D642|nr:hypothetical protein [Streptomyces noursei]MCZ1013533.1 hypothetical protein [Streptomyces noursei]GGX35689.1 hypothetical protein GCM10010341_66460 [Streptomyces noursei]
MFVGKLDEKYPQRGASDGLTGEGKHTYKVTASVADEKSTTEGGEVGGKITPSISGGNGSVGGEAGFTYGYSTTSTTKVQSTRETDVEIDVPQGKKGYLEGRANGATYTGYIVVRDLDTGNNQEHLIAIPAKVFIQAAGSSSPVTWVAAQGRVTGRPGPWPGPGRCLCCSPRSLCTRRVRHSGAP